MKKLRPLASLILSFLLVCVSPSTFALQIKVRKQINLRVQDEGRMVKSGRLLAGSVVQIPDEFTVYDNKNKPNIELTLNNWLRGGKNLSNTSTPKTYEMEGHRFDFFFPVQVVKAVKGSRTPKNKSFYIALKSLAKKRGYFEVIEDSPTYSPPALPTSDPNDALARTEAQGPTVACDNCSAPSNPFESFLEPLQTIINFLPQTLGNLSKDLDQKTTNLSENLEVAEQYFNSNCNSKMSTEQKKSYGQFLNIIKQETGDDELLFNLLKNKMAIEGQNKCFSRRHEQNGTYSVGLFQINTGVSSYKVCSSNEIEKIKSTSFENLASGPLCLDNPILNLKESVRMIKENERLLFGQTKFDTTQMSESDRLKIIVAAYNGGHRYVLDARQNLLDFVAHNKAQGIDLNLNPNHWDDLKIFFFRGALNYNEQIQTFGEYKSRKRATHNATGNVAHADALVDSVADTG